MLVDHGEDVRAGDPIAEQDTSPLGLQKDELETARAKASSELGKLIANSQLRSMESVRIEVGDLQTELNQIKEEIKAQENPNPGAQVRLDKAQQRLDILDAVSGDPQVTAQQAVIAELDSQLAALEVQLAQGTLLAPFDGTVAQRFVNEGTMVSPGVAIVRLVETNSPQAWISIPSDAAQDAREGESHVIHVDGKKLGATVSAKLPELDRTTRTRTIIFSLDNIDADTNSMRTLPGAVARIELGREVESPGFWLPITSLTRGSRGLWSVYAVARMGDGKRIVSRRSVEVIHTEGERARVRGTLDDGDLVISDGTHRVVPGQRVEPIEVSATRELSRSDLGRSP
jgi:RND family efflux transporter MFP subunit